MHNNELIGDYLKRAKARIKAVKVLLDEKSYADTVRESQEVIELSLKALLRANQIEAPRIHDVSNIILENLSQIKDLSKAELEKMAAISHNLRRDRELSFYGSEDLTPSEFYNEKDAKEAFDGACWVCERVCAAALKET